MSAAPEPDIIAELLENLLHGRPSERPAAARALGRVGNESVVPHLLACLDDRDLTLRTAASDSLAELGFLDPLIAVLAESDRDRRRAILVTLEKMGPRAAAAMPVLIAALDDPDLCEEAAHAIDGIRHAPSPWARVVADPRGWLLAALALLLVLNILVMASAARELLAAGGQSAATAAWMIGALGTAAGATVGASRSGRHSAVVGALVFGIGGGLSGLLLGALLGTLMAPLLRVLERGW